MGGTGKKRKTGFYCLYQGSNTTHNTDDCKVLEAQAEKMVAVHSNLGAGKYKKERHSNSKKGLESFKAEIVRSVVSSLTNQGSSESNPTRSKKQRVTEDNSNMNNFRNLSVSDSSEESQSGNDSGSESNSS